VDKYEYKHLVEQIQSLIDQGKYADAVAIADKIDWRRVRSVMTLGIISDLYKINGRYEDARDILLLAYDRKPQSRQICYSLCELYIKTGDPVEAAEFYKEFEKLAPKDPGRYVLKYKLYAAYDVSIDEKIEVLEKLKEEEYQEKWMYELASLYHKRGLGTKCVEVCDELILWFGTGKYVNMAMELKMLHEPLTPSQQQKYDHRFEPEHPAQEMREVTYAPETPAEHPIQNVQDGQNAQHEEVPQTTMVWNANEVAQETADQMGATRVFNVDEVRRQLQNQNAADDMDIQVKTVDVGQYNTMNLQEELAKGLKELLENDSQQAPEPEKKDGNLDPITRVLVSPMLDPDADSGPLDLPVIEGIEEEEELEAAEAMATQEAASEAAETATHPVPTGEMYQDENGYFHDASEVVPKKESISALEKEAMTAQPPESMAKVLTQEADGQLKLVMPESKKLEKQITGQLSIEDIRAEWERMKQESQAKQEEETRQQVLRQTGRMFTEFEEALRDNILKQMESTIDPASFATEPTPEELMAEAEATKTVSEETAKTASEEDATKTAGEEDVIKTASEEDASKMISEEEASKDDTKEPEANMEFESLAFGEVDWEPTESVKAEKVDEEKTEASEDAEEAKEAEEKETADVEAVTIEETRVDETETEKAEASEEVKEDEAEETEEEKAEDADKIQFDEVVEEAEASEDAEADKESGDASDDDTLEFASDWDMEGMEEDAFHEFRERMATKDAAEDQKALEAEEDWTIEAAEETEEVEEPKAGRKSIFETARAGIKPIEEDAQGDDFSWSDEALEDPEEKIEPSPWFSNRETKTSDGAISFDNLPEEEDEHEEADAEETPAEDKKDGQSQVRELTKEEEELYENLLQTDSDREQLVRALDNISMAAYTGNVIITGDAGMNTLELAKKMIFEVKQSDSNFSGKVAKIPGKALNNKDLTKLLDDLKNGALIVEKTSDLSEKSVADLYKNLQRENFGLIVVLLDTKKAMKKFLKAHGELVPAFNARVDMQPLSNDALARYACQYAKEKEYSIDNLGMLALHMKIDELQTADHAVTTNDIEEIIDDAIYSASRKTIGHFLDIILGKRYDEEDMIIITEKDFK
jgi:tetratricopeptide (TPR) repeat protein